MSAASQSPLISVERLRFHANLASSGLLCFNVKSKKNKKSGISEEVTVPSIADADNRDSVKIAADIFRRIGVTGTSKQLSAQKAGSEFEVACREFLRATFLQLSHLRPGKWDVASLSARSRLGLADYEQYAHLAAVAKACAADPELSAALGQDYLIAPDLIVVRGLEPDSRINLEGFPVVDENVARNASIRLANGGKPLLHASISCKFTMRSDRAQNSRSEALNLIRSRKGRVPHIAVVTAEPLPSRLASLALGTGDMDCVYHFALPELRAAIDAVGGDDSKESIRIMVDGKRLRDIADLPLDLAI